MRSYWGKKLVNGLSENKQSEYSHDPALDYG